MTSELHPVTAQGWLCVLEISKLCMDSWLHTETWKLCKTWGEELPPLATALSSSWAHPGLLWKAGDPPAWPHISLSQQSSTHIWAALPARGLVETSKTTQHKVNWTEQGAPAWLEKEKYKPYKWECPISAGFRSNICPVLASTCLMKDYKWNPYQELAKNCSGLAVKRAILWCLSVP